MRRYLSITFLHSQVVVSSSAQSTLLWKAALPHQRREVLSSHLRVASFTPTSTCVTHTIKTSRHQTRCSQTSKNRSYNHDAIAATAHRIVADTAALCIIFLCCHGIDGTTLWCGECIGWALTFNRIKVLLFIHTPILNWPTLFRGLCMSGVSRKHPFWMVEKPACQYKKRVQLNQQRKNE